MFPKNKKKLGKALMKIQDVIESTKIEILQKYKDDIGIEVAEYEKFDEFIET